MTGKSALILLAFFAVLPSFTLGASPSTGTVRLSGSDREGLSEALEGLKRGAFVTVELMNGNVMPGLFQSYDDYYEKVWIIPKGDAGLFQAKSVRLSSIRSIEVSESKPAPRKPAEPTDGPDLFGEDTR